MTIATDRLRQLAVAATPGPWTVSGIVADAIVDPHGCLIVSPNSVVACADHEFILAASPDVVLSLLDEVDRLRGLPARAGDHEAEDATTAERVRDHFIGPTIRDEGGARTSDGIQRIRPGRVVRALATLIEVLDSRGVLSAEDVDRILSE